MTPEVALRNIGLYSAQIGILIVIGAVLLWVFRLRAPRAQLVFWYALLGLCILLPWVQPWHQPPAQAPGGITFTTHAFVPGDDAGNGAWFAWNLGWFGAALLALACGGAVRFGWLMLGILKLQRLRSNARPAAMSPALGRARAAVNIDAAFLCSEDVAGPVTFGVKRPVILLPPAFFDLESAEQESVAIHELLHVRRSDWLYTLAEECVRAVLWFHPAIWFLLNRVQLAREQWVDETVVASTCLADEYVGALLKIAAARIEPDLAPAPLFLKRRHLRERVAAIVKGANMSKSRVTLSLFAVLSMLTIAAGILAWQIPLEAAPQEVRDAQGVEVSTGYFKVLHRNPVDYPAEARSRAISGYVVVAVNVNEQGEVTDAKVISGPEELRKPVLASVLGWHFATGPVQVGAVDSRPVPPSFEIGVRFTATAAGPVAVSAGGTTVPPGKTLTVQHVDVAALPEVLREKVQSVLRASTGETIGPERLSELERSVEAVDNHLRLTASIKDGTLHVTLAGAMSPAPHRIRVGSNVQAANLIQKVTPKYPMEAKANRVQGVVQLQAVIGKDGTVQNLELISGDPLLVPSAVEAVKQWVYKPVLLNGEPVEVVTQIDVNYTLLY